MESSPGRPPWAAKRPLLSTNFHRQSSSRGIAVSSETALAAGVRLWIATPGTGPGRGLLAYRRRGRGRRPLHVERDVLEQALGVAHERLPALGSPELEAVEHA